MISTPSCSIVGDLPMTSWSSVGGLGRSRGLCWLSCATLGAYVGGLGPLLGPLWAVLGCSWGLRGRSWPLSGPLLAVLCRSWGLCWRCWAALGTFVGGPGPSWAEKWPWPEREAIWQADLGEKLPALERERDPKGSGPPNRHNRHKRHRPPQAIYQLIKESF